MSRTGEKGGKFIISLDFELLWGVLDHVSKGSLYRNNIKNVSMVIPSLLKVFQEYGIHATFAVVGMIFHKDFSSLFSYQPSLLPSYRDSIFNPYSKWEQIILDEPEYYLAPELIRMIKACPGMEVASHTYSHYYCLESGQNAEQFRADMEMAVKIALQNGIVLKSVIFPRNQVNEAYLKICRDLGIKAVRTNEKGWMYRASDKKGNTLYKRIFRLLDVYVNMTGYNCYKAEQLEKVDGILYIPASRFLRPYSCKLTLLEGVKMKRIKNSMTFAAKNGKVFHLWWHPHNFGTNLELNFSMLEKILKHYKMLNQSYGFTSVNMSELTDSLKADEYN